MSVRTSLSFEYKSEESAGRICWRTLIEGAGFLLRHKLDKVHVIFRRNVLGVSGRIRAKSGSTIPHLMTRSLSSEPSPAIFPSAHTACSHTFELGDESSFTKGPTAPISTTCRVCKDVPEAMLVRAHAASNWSMGCSTQPKYLTRLCTRLAFMTSSMGGFRSRDNILRMACTAGKSCSLSLVVCMISIISLRAKLGWATVVAAFVLSASGSSSSLTLMLRRLSA